MQCLQLKHMYRGLSWLLDAAAPLPADTCHRIPVAAVLGRWGLVPSFTRKDDKPDFWRMVRAALQHHDSLLRLLCFARGLKGSLAARFATGCCCIPGAALVAARFEAAAGVLPSLSKESSQLRGLRIHAMLSLVVQCPKRVCGREAILPAAGAHAALPGAHRGLLRVAQGVPPAHVLQPVHYGRFMATLLCRRWHQMCMLPSITATGNVTSALHDPAHPCAAMQEKGGAKQPYYIHLAHAEGEEEEPLVMAGLWDVWDG